MKCDFHSVDGSCAGDWVGGVAVDELEVTINVREVLKRPGTQIVQNPDIVTFVDESRHDMRPDESRAAGYPDSWSQFCPQPVSPVFPLVSKPADLPMSGKASIVVRNAGFRRPNSSIHNWLARTSVWHSTKSCGV